MNHVDVQTLLAFSQGAVSDEVRSHIAGCTRCRDLAAVVGLELEPPSPTSTVSEDLYEDIRLHGKGGMGEVYLATDRRLNRRVVLKMPPRDCDSVRYLKLAARLEHERAILSRLNHPSIPPVFEGGQFGTDREPFFAMPIAGIEPLTKTVARLERLEDRMALLPSLISVAEGVAYAHRNGVIHRDIKPDHVLLGVDGEARLIDWGLAKVLEQDRSLEPPAGEQVEPLSAEAHRGDLLATVQGLYTEGYSAPEQQQNAPGEKHFDVYGLGATLYYLLTGNHPKVPQPTRSTFPRQCPHDLVKIVQKAMHTNPASRYRDAGALAQVLKKFQAGRLVHPSLAQRVEDWIRRRAVTILTAAALVGLIIASRANAEHRDALEETNRLYQSRLDRVKGDAKTAANATSRLEQMYTRLLGHIQNLEATSTATIAALSERLAQTRQAHARSSHLLRQNRAERERLERQWTVTRSELGRASETVLILQEQLEQREFERRQIHEQLERSKVELAQAGRRLSASNARVERQQRRIAELTRKLKRQRNGLEFPAAPLDLQTFMPRINRGPSFSSHRPR